MNFIRVAALRIGKTASLYIAKIDWQGLVSTFLTNWRKICVISVGIAALCLFVVRMVSSVDVLHWLEKRASPRLVEWPYWLIDAAGNLLLAATLTTIVLAGLQRKLIIRQSAPTSENLRERIHADEPIGPDGDMFFRNDLALAISEEVLLPADSDSVVFALEGRWGDGKTSVLNGIEKILVESPHKPIVVRFNPWMVSGPTAIREAFFSQFVESLRNEDGKELAKIVGFVALLLRGFENPVTSTLFERYVSRPLFGGGDRDSKDLRSLYERIGSQVSKLNRPIVVIMDDIDRLPAEDVLAVFQLVKAVAKLPRAAYLLAYDGSVIDKILDRTNAPDAQNFRHKIVQVSIRLPKVGYKHRLNFIEARLARTIELRRLNLSNQEQELLHEACPRALEVLRTPRDVKRSLNSASLIHDRLRDEVVLADIWLFEILRISHPDLTDRMIADPSIIGAVENRSDYMAEEEILGEMMEEQEASSTGKSRLMTLVATLILERQSVERVLRFLFPAAMNQEAPSPRLAAMRLCRPENFLKLAYVGRQDVLPSVREHKEFLEGSIDREAMLASICQDGVLQIFSQHLEATLSSASVKDPARLVTMLFDAVVRVYSIGRVDATAAVTAFAFSLLGTLKEDADRVAVLEDVYGDMDRIVVCERLLVLMLDDAGLWASGNRLSIDDRLVGKNSSIHWQSVNLLNEVVDDWTQRARKCDVSKAVAELPNLLGFLRRSGQFSVPPFRDLKRRLSIAIKDPNVAVSFANHFADGTSLSGVGKLLDRRELMRLTELTTDQGVKPQAIDAIRTYIEMRDAKKSGPSALRSTSQ